MENIKKYWEAFLEKTNRAATTKYFEVFYFGNSEQAAAQLVTLVLEGKKTATTSSVYQYNSVNDYPKVGDLSIVTDYWGQPQCVIETKAVQQLQFQQMTFEVCCREGEDETLESWQQNHISFFKEVGEASGFDFSFDMEIIFEDFEVVYR